MFDLIIVGGGPAGITAGIYAARKKLNTLLITEDFVGQTGKAFDVENYPGFKKIRGIDLIERFKEHLLKFEVETKHGKVSKIEKEKDIFKVRIEAGGQFESRAVIIATGRDPRPLEVPGEKELLGRGVGYCVTCDGPLFSGKKVAVVGGGNSGLEAALELSTYCRHVYLLEIKKEAAGDELLQAQIKEKDNIDLLTQAKTKKIRGKDQVSSLVYEDLTSHAEKEVEVEGVFIEVGYMPATGFVDALVDFNDWDEVVVDPRTNMSKTKGLFAAGDVTDVPYKQIVVAVGEGAKAALSAYKYLKNQLDAD